MHPFKLAVLVSTSLALAGCATQGLRPAPTAVSAAAKPTWAFEASDVAVDPAFKFGKLANGMRYVIRANATPKGTAVVRMEVAAAALDEADSERGYAHFLEHMAFNGSAKVPEGDMVKLLERNGLAFGAHTNASTGFEQTTYKLDLQRNDPKLLDTALMLMRETASELTIADEAVARERGVVLSEMRDRNTYAYRNLIDGLEFGAPGALFSRRLPIGTTEALTAATGDSLRAFYRREYVPAQTTVIVIGDFDPALVESQIRTHFSGWAAAPAAPQPDAGPVDPADRNRSDIFIDPALSERVTISRNGRWLDEPDSVAQRREQLLREIGNGIINRRLIRLARRADAPFRGAGFSTTDIFRSGRTSNLVIETVDGKWNRGLTAATIEYRRALAQGFTAGEVAEQVAEVRTAARNLAASADTRSNGALAQAVFNLLHDGLVPATPESSLARLEAFIPAITPKAVIAAVKREAVPLVDPLIRFQGRREPEGGVTALRNAWNAAMRAPLGKADAAVATGFGYTDFGSPGQVTADTRESALGIREVRFANGVRLNLKRTDLDKGKALVQVSVDGGEMLNTRNAALTTEMTQALTAGGLGKHSQDDLQSLLAGRSVSLNFSAGPETFTSSAQTTPDDLELQLQLMAALLTDPGYRPEGEVIYRQSVNNFFLARRATPNAALSNEIGGILSDQDPRFSLLDIEAYRALTFAQLKRDLADRLARGAIEIGIVGDIDEDRAIALVGKTFGALAPREPEFRSYDDQRVRTFTARRDDQMVYHTGAADQAIVRLTWLTRDGEDPAADMALELLQRVAQIGLTENLREKLGKTYSPGSSSDPSRVWRNYGTFAIAASVDVKEVAATRAAMLETIAELRDRPVSEDVLLRARAPLIDGIDNALKSNGGWLGIVDRAQTQSDRIERLLQGKARAAAVTPADLQALARRYLAASSAVPIIVLPEAAKP